MDRRSGPEIRQEISDADREMLRALAPEGQGEIEAYQEAVPYPLAAARAKGRRFDEAARRRAGLSGKFIAFVRGARSSQEQNPGASRNRNGG
jgi:hypothetical protein